MEKPHPVPPERIPPEQRLHEIAQILAQGLLRLREYNALRPTSSHG